MCVRIYLVIVFPAALRVIEDYLMKRLRVCVFANGVSRLWVRCGDKAAGEACVCLLGRVLTNGLITKSQIIGWAYTLD